MSTKKGQNFRITVLDSTLGKYKVIGMSQSCTVTLTNNTDDQSTKDDTGLATKAGTVSKGWGVSVETLNVVDSAAMLTAIKSMSPVTLMWDEVSTSDNQTRQNAAYARKGQAYLNDLTLTFNNRETAAKSLQFTGTGALDVVAVADVVQVIPLGSYTQGQFVRLFLGSDNTTTPSKVIAAAMQLSLHVSLTLEDATTKDTTGDWLVQEPTGLSYDISTTALVGSADTITSAVGGQTLTDLNSIYESGEPVKWQIANVSGDNQRSKGSIIASGSATLTQLTLNAPNKQNFDYTAQLNGYGDYTVAA